MMLAIIFPLQGLADMTSRLTLIIFALVNAALVRLKQKTLSVPSNAFIVPILVPIAGCMLCLALLIGGLTV
jgi:basic amino acid/polyamine antiporter, APA family